MTPDESAFFRTHGYLGLPGFHSKVRLDSTRRKLLDETKRLVGPGGTLRSARALPIFQQIGRLSRAVSIPNLHEVLVTPKLIDHVTLLAGRKPSSIQGTELLLSPSHQGTWTLEGLNWHVDIGAEQRDRIPGIQAFFLIDDVARQGGATLALAGSHRVGGPRSESQSAIRKALRAEDAIEDALRRFGVTVVEMCGRAGDAFLMDMRLLHSPSVNATPRVRLMATCRCLFGP